MMSRRGSPSVLGAMGDPDLIAMQKDPERTYLRNAPYGSMHPQERIEVLDAEHIDIAILYTTVGLLWEAEVLDPALAQAYTTAYNRWICDFCRDEPRLVPTAHLSLSDAPAAAQGARAGRRRRGQGRLRRPVPPRRPAARPPGQRRAVRRRPGPRRAAGDPPDVRAAVDEGHPHGDVGQRQAAPAAGHGGRRRRRAPPVHDAVRLRRLRQVPEPQGPRARVGRRLDRLLARPHRRRVQPHRHRRARAARSTSRATTSASASGSAAIPTSG